jgi:hypothetical protein
MSNTFGSNSLLCVAPNELALERFSSGEPYVDAPVDARFHWYSPSPVASCDGTSISNGTKRFCTAT